MAQGGHRIRSYLRIEPHLGEEVARCQLQEGKSQHRNAHHKKQPMKKSHSEISQHGSRLVRPPCGRSKIKHQPQSYCKGGPCGRSCASKMPTPRLWTFERPE